MSILIQTVSIILSAINFFSLEIIYNSSHDHFFNVFFVKLKLLVQPRRKIAEVKSRVDNRPPQIYPHVYYDMKKLRVSIIGQ